MDTKLRKYVIWNLVLSMMVLGGGSLLNAQNCSNYASKCRLTDSSFSVSSQSAGLEIHRGQKLLVICTFYAGKENYISVCGDPDLDTLNFKIIDYETLNFLYDNSENSFKQYVSFKTELTVKVAIEISSPKASFPDIETRCVGLLIGYKDL